MATVEFVPNAPKPDIDARLEEAAAQAALASRPIRIRLNPTFYNYDNSSYMSWLGVVWMIDADSLEEGRRLREGLELFMRAFGDGAKQEPLMTSLKRLVG